MKYWPFVMTFAWVLIGKSTYFSGPCRALNHSLMLGRLPTGYKDPKNMNEFDQIVHKKLCLRRLLEEKGSPKKVICLFAQAPPGTLLAAN